MPEQLLSWASEAFLGGEAKYLLEKILKLIQRGLTKVLKTNIEPPEVSIC